MTVERTTTVDQSDPDWGRYDPGCVGKPNPADTEPYPVPFNRMSDAMQDPQSRMDALDQDLGSKWAGPNRRHQGRNRRSERQAGRRAPGSHLSRTGGSSPSRAYLPFSTCFLGTHSRNTRV
jgi:hypothetical protein